jgi:hypothetical protein
MIDLINFINISVSQTPVGLGEVNINNVALFTDDDPISAYFDTYGAYVSAAAVGAAFGTGTETYQQAQALFSQQPNILQGGGNLIIIPFEDGSETIAEAIERTKDTVFYCGVISTRYPSSGDMPDAADDIQAFGDKILILPSTTVGDIAGAFTTIKNASDFATRCLYCSTSALDARLYAAAYAGRFFSTNFDASNGCQTMNLKSLITIDPDEGIDQTIFLNCQTAGVDIYVSVAGISSNVSNGTNRFADQVLNMMWLVSALKVAGFNALRQVGGKVPQTEAGVSVLKGAYRGVCERGLVNGYMAAGTWTSSETFGDQENMLASIAQRGYYIYSIPVSQQSNVDREARQAPLIQIAIKEAGAIHSSEVIVAINP